MHKAILPHVMLECVPKQLLNETPNPIHESQLLQSYSLFATKPIRTYMSVISTKKNACAFRLNPSLLQLFCKDEPAISDFHELLPAVVSVVAPPAITLNSELALWLITIHFVTLLTFIPRHILSNGVFQ